MLGYGLGKWQRYYYRALTMFRRIHEYFVAFKWHIKQFSEEINYKSLRIIYKKKDPKTKKGKGGNGNLYNSKAQKS